MKFNYQIIIEYIGSNFSGWQIQKNVNSIQAEVEKAVNKTINSKIRLIGSGRTDAGVNAFGQSANFFCEKKISNYFKFLSSANYFLQKKLISIIELKRRNLKFHARHSAKKREYVYVILNRVAKPSIDTDRVWLVKKELNVREMKKAIKHFLGTHDFSAFRSSSCSAKDPIKLCYKQVFKKGNKILIKFISKSFCRNKLDQWLDV